MMSNRDFDDDEKDSGEIGAGHTVTAIYEIVPAGTESEMAKESPSKFVESKIKKDVDPNTMLIVNLRYKKPTSTVSKLFSVDLKHSQDTKAPNASQEFQFASAVAAFGMKLRDSKFSGTADWGWDWDWDWIIKTAQKSTGKDEDGFRSEFVGLTKRARMICNQ